MESWTALRGMELQENKMKHKKVKVYRKSICLERTYS